MGQKRVERWYMAPGVSERTSEEERGGGGGPRTDDDNVGAHVDVPEKNIEKNRE